jgi:hypothetical protein
MPGGYMAGGEIKASEGLDVGLPCNAGNKKETECAVKGRIADHAKCYKSYDDRTKGSITA